MIKIQNPAKQDALSCVAGDVKLSDNKCLINPE